MTEKGVTFVEVLVGAGLVAMVSLAVLATVSNSVVFTGDAEKIYTSSILAQRRIDVLKKFPFDELAYIAPESDIPIDYDNNGTTDYYRTTEITANQAGYSGLLKIKVSVARDIKGKKSTNPVVMETLFADVDE